MSTDLLSILQESQKESVRKFLETDALESNVSINGDRVMIIPAHMAQEIQDYIRSFQRWIPVSERTPKNREEIIALDGGVPEQSIYIDGEFEVTSDRQSDFGPSYFEHVSHWKPMPEPPEDL